MEYRAVCEIVFKKKKGSFSSIIYKHEYDIPKKFGYSGKIIKITKDMVRFGVSYDNIGSVIKKRENGELPKSNSGLPWGEWLIKNYIIKHNSSLYLRCNTLNNYEKKVIYVYNNRVVPEYFVEKIVPKATRNANKDVFSINIENIIYIG